MKNKCESLYVLIKFQGIEKMGLKHRLAKQTVKSLTIHHSFYNSINILLLSRNNSFQLKNSNFELELGEKLRV